MIVSPLCGGSSFTLSSLPFFSFDFHVPFFLDFPSPPPPAYVDEHSSARAPFSPIDRTCGPPSHSLNMMVFNHFRFFLRPPSTAYRSARTATNDPHSSLISFLFFYAALSTVRSRTPHLPTRRLVLVFSIFFDSSAPSQNEERVTYLIPPFAQGRCSVRSIPYRNSSVRRRFLQSHLSGLRSATPRPPHNLCAPSQQTLTLRSTSSKARLISSVLAALLFFPHQNLQMFLLCMRSRPF